MTAITRRTVVLLCAALVFGAGCIPLRNAPAGGGTTVTKSFTYGPFTLGPGQEAMGSPASGLPRPTGAFGLKHIDFDLVDDQGMPIPKHMVHLHHIVLTNQAHDDALCPGRAERFAGAGMERTPINLWGPYTYLVGANDQWGAIYHIMNMMPAGSETMKVFVKYTIAYQPGANATNSRNVMPLFMDTTGCGGSTFDVPGNGGPGSLFTQTRAWDAPRDGILVFAGGHLHDGGVDIALREQNGTAVNCTSTAVYDDMGMLDKIPACVLHDQITAGRTYRVTGRYDNSQPYQDVMAIELAYVWWGTQ
jgi:hypothetical protein